MQWWQWLLISLGAFLAIYASFLARLVIHGRNEGCTIASGPSLSVAEAIVRQSAHPVAIHGYFEAADDGTSMQASSLS